MFTVCVGIAAQDCHGSEARQSGHPMQPDSNACLAGLLVVSLTCLEFRGLDVSHCCLQHVGRGANLLWQKLPLRTVKKKQ